MIKFCAASPFGLVQKLLLYTKHTVIIQLVYWIFLYGAYFYFIYFCLVKIGIVDQNPIYVYMYMAIK